jgi:DNA primase
LADFLKEAAKLIAAMSPVEQDYYIKKLSRETGISENAIGLQVQNNGKRVQAEPAPGERAPKPVQAGSDLLCSIIGLALGSGYALEKAAACRHLFEGTDYGGVMHAMLMMKERTGAAPLASELSELLDEADQAALDLAVRKAAAGRDDTYEERIDEYLIKLELVALRSDESLLKESSALDSAGEDAETLKELMEIQNRIKKLESDIRSGKRGD